MSDENIIKKEIFRELTYIKRFGSKIFLCPFISRTKLQIMGYYVVSVLMICTIAQLFFTLISTETNNWLEVINIAPNLGVIVMGYIKYTNIHSNRELYEEIFYHFRDGMWSIVATQSQEHQKLVKNYKRLVMIVNRFLLYYAIPLTIMIDSFPYLFMVYENKIHGAQSDYLYPFDAWYPFDKVKWYAIAYIWESFMTAVVIVIFVFSNIIHGSYIGFICMELRILGNCLEEIIKPEDINKIQKGDNVEEIHRVVVRKLKKIIAKHDFLAKISSKLNEVLGDAMILNYSLGAIFICLTAFTSTVIDVTYKRIRYFLMFMSLLIEVFSQCLIGQILDDHSTNITEAVYFSDWSYASPEAKKLMLMFMMRTQKPFQLTGNGYIVMNMYSFSRICSSSYQFYNLLRTLYQ